jgi:hypothetical protein
MMHISREPHTQSQQSHQIYDSVVTLAFAFVTLTPKALALATISNLLRADTACAILRNGLVSVCERGERGVLLGGVGAVVHEE